VNVPVSLPIKPRLPLLTTSAQKTYRGCPRKYKLRYVDGIRPAAEDADALVFGKAMHGALDPWWRRVGADRLAAALAAIADMQLDPFDRVRLEELIRGYHFRWVEETDATMQVLAVEEPYCVPLRNPETGAPSRSYEHGGCKDAKVLRDGVWIVEHKTSSENIAPGSAYWQQLRLDVQVSNYFNAAAEAGEDVRGCIYDVIGKPTIRPAKATALEARKYTKTGALYANQRDTDEGPEEFRSRLREHIAENPERYYQRGDVVRLEAEAREAAADMWLTAYAIREAQRLDHWPRNTARCFDWSRPCAYWAACSGEASLDDPLRFRRVEQVHTELHIEQETPNGNTSESDSERQRLFPDEPQLSAAR
jgi:hypothetical protein